MPLMFPTCRILRRRIAPAGFLAAVAVSWFAFVGCVGEDATPQPGAPDVSDPRPDLQDVAEDLLDEASTDDPELEEEVDAEPCGGCPQGLVCHEDRCQLPDCVQGGGRCVGQGVVQPCNEEGDALEASIPCSDTDACEPGQTCLCFRGDCYPEEPCTVGARRCRGDEAQVCAVGGRFWTVARVCDADREQVCEGGTCRCPQGRTLCGETCIDARTDSENCGGCGIRCDEGLTCSGSGCVCPSGKRSCDGRCVDVTTDALHCGGCGNACPDGQLCGSGRCGCEGGGEVCDGVCTDVQQSDDHCGGCGNACPSGAQCVSGNCVCDNGLTLCGGRCVSTQSDREHCNGCFTACPAGLTCQQGSCACPSGQELCGQTCIDTRTDLTHCGRCNNACRGTCTGGICTTGCTCGVGTIYCRPGQGACPPGSRGCCTILADVDCALAFQGCTN